MHHLFYLIGVAPILWELSNLLSPVRYYHFRKGLVAMKGKPIESFTTSQKSVAILNLGYTIWVIVGLFTSQWLVFAALFTFSLIPKKHIIMHVIDAFVCFLIIVFIIINRYHLHIDLLALITA